MADTTAAERVRVDPARLETLVATAYERLGMPADHARIAAHGVVLADLRGHESHGVSNNLFGFYLPGLRSGDINARPNIRILQESATTARWDADRGMGFVVGDIVMRDVMERAERYGCGFGAVANSRHYGMAQIYSLMALERNMIGMSMTNGVTPGVVPFQGREAKLGTNPITVTAPAGTEPPFVLDMATTTVAYGKIQNAQRDGRTVPPTWGLDRDGHTTTDPQAAMDGLRLLPLGATKEGSGHKGYGLGLWVDIFCGALSGSGFTAKAGEEENVNHFFGAWRVDAFVPVDEFKRLMDGRMRDLVSTPPLDGFDRVLYAGLPEWEAEQDRMAHGVALHPSVIVKLRGLADELGLAFDLLP